MLTVRYRRERFTAGARMSRKDEVPENRQLLSPFLFAMVKKGPGFLHSVYRWAKSQV